MYNGTKLTKCSVYTFGSLEKGFESDDTLQYYGACSQVTGFLIAEFHYVSPSGGSCYQTGYPVWLGVYFDFYIGEESV